MIVGNVNETIDTFVEDIKSELQGKDIRIKYLEKQNQELRDEKYKDNELSRMESELKTMHEGRLLSRFSDIRRRAEKYP